MTAAVAAVTTVAAQLESRLAALPFFNVQDVVMNAVASGDWLALLPAPIAAVVGYFARKSRGDGVLKDDTTEAPVVVPPGADLDDLSDVKIPGWMLDGDDVHYFEDRDRLYFSYAELLDGMHRKQPPSERDEYLEYVDQRLASVERDLEGVRGTVSRQPLLMDRLDSLERRMNGMAEGIGTEKVDDAMSKINTLSNRFEGTATNLRARLQQIDARVRAIRDEVFENGADIELGEPAAPGDLPPNQPTPSRETGPRNWRNKNPGNIEITAEGRTKWRGEIDGDDLRFATFETDLLGARAMMKLLRNYQIKYGLNTIAGIVGRWSPQDDPTNAAGTTAAYANHVAQLTGFAVDKELDLSREEHLVPLAVAMAHHEGGQPYPNADRIFTESFRKYLSTPA